MGGRVFVLKVMSVIDKRTETQCHGMGIVQAPAPERESARASMVGSLKRGTETTRQNKDGGVS